MSLLSLFPVLLPSRVSRAVQVAGTAGLLSVLSACSVWPWAGGGSAASGSGAPAPAAPARNVPDYRAAGNEPGWAVSLGAQASQLQLLGQAPVSWGAVPVQRSGSVQRWQAQVQGTDFELTALPGLCRDSMTGMPKPDSVTLRWGDQTLRGCGGEASSLLLGGEWAVQSLQGQPLVERSRMTLRFTAEGRVSGLASCNHYTGIWRLTAEGLTLNPPAVTMAACAPAVMQQEERALALLKAVHRFDISPQGELVLLTADGRQLRARRD